MKVVIKYKVGTKLIIVGFLSAMISAVVASNFEKPPIWLTGIGLAGAALTFLGITMTKSGLAQKDLPTQPAEGECDEQG
jgi:threonine/homoserine/homoserine lactone efflux protein